MFNQIRKLKNTDVSLGDYDMLKLNKNKTSNLS